MQEIRYRTIPHGWAFRPMTGNPDTITPDDLALTGLQMMEDGCYRHLPVIENGRVIGLISRVDFPGEEKTELETERHCWERLG